MAKGEKILHSDIIEKGDPFATLKKSIVESTELMDNFNKVSAKNPMSGGKDAKENIKLQTELNKALKDLYKSEDQLLKVKEKMSVVSEKNKDIQERELGTLEKIKQENKQLRKELDQLDLTKAKGQARQKEINNQLDQNTKTLYKNSDAFVKQKMDIGNYQLALKGVQTVLTKVMGVFAAGGIVVTTFNKVIATSDNLTDKYHETMKGLDKAVNVFFTTIRNGDWSNLTTNMKKAYDIGVEYEKQINRLSDRRRALDFATVEEKKTYSDLEEKIKNVLIPMEERQKAGEEWKKLVGEVYEREKIYYQDAVKAELTNLNFKGMEIDAAEELMRQYLLLDAMNPTLRAEAEKYNEALEKRNKLLDTRKINITTSPEGITTTEFSNEPDPQKVQLLAAAQEKLNGFSQEAIKYGELLNKVENKRPEEIQRTIDALKEKGAAEFAMYQENKRTFNIINSITKKNIDANEVIVKDYQETIDQMNTVDQERVQTYDQTLVTKKESEEEFFNWLDEKRNESLQNELDVIDKAKAEQEKAQAKQAAIDFAAYAINSLYQIQNDAIRAELQDAETLYQHKIQLAGDDVAKRTAAENEYQKKTKELKRKEAKNNRDIATFNAIINTANAITAALSVPYIGGILAALYAILGAAQIVAIQSQPLPSFRKGTDYLKANGTGSDRDGVLVQAHEGERILTAEQNKKLGNIENSQLPGLVYLGKKYNSEFPILAAIAEKQVKEQQKTNGLLKKFKFIDKNGNIITLEGNVIINV